MNLCVAFLLVIRVSYNRTVWWIIFQTPVCVEVIHVIMAVPVTSEMAPTTVNVHLASKGGTVYRVWYLNTSISVVGGRGSLYVVTSWLAAWPHLNSGGMSLSHVPSGGGSYSGGSPWQRPLWTETPQAETSYLTPKQKPPWMHSFLNGHVMIIVNWKKLHTVC